jgi:AraC family transcriptional regulator
MSYLDQVNRAIDAIEENLCSSLPLESIAKEAGLSKWYFQKIFRGMVGDTVREYILKRRLSLAARDLINSNQKVIDIAIAYGFDSHEVFTRAFKRVFKKLRLSFEILILLNL